MPRRPCSRLRHRAPRRARRARRAAPQHDRRGRGSPRGRGSSSRDGDMQCPHAPPARDRLPARARPRVRRAARGCRAGRAGRILSTADRASFARLASSLRGAEGLAVSGVGRGQTVERVGSLRSAIAWSTSKVPVAMAVLAAGQGDAHASDSRRPSRRPTTPPRCGSGPRWAATPRRRRASAQSHRHSLRRRAWLAAGVSSSSSTAGSAARSPSASAHKLAVAIASAPSDGSRPDDAAGIGPVLRHRHADAKIPTATAAGRARDDRPPPPSSRRTRSSLSRAVELPARSPPPAAPRRGQPAGLSSTCSRLVYLVWLEPKVDWLRRFPTQPEEILQYMAYALRASWPRRRRRRRR